MRVGSRVGVNADTLRCPCLLTPIVMVPAELLRQNACVGWVVGMDISVGCDPLFLNGVVEDVRIVKSGRRHAG